MTPEPLKAKVKTYVEADYYEGTTINHSAFDVEDIRSAVEWLKEKINHRHHNTGVPAKETQDVFREINEAFEDVI